ncbi:suppressor of fused domain protein [Roseateles chitosanitabidus]|uniref:suppressor of fused domain protein n=1 Tax=Roseateles chitosanitabidus TaxID=65048 RepID=UPI0008377DDF|nr:suppressor of fused domain protein [Roseateles chitosanitabidus]
MTVEQVPVDGGSVNLLIAKARAPLPSGVALPSGRMKLLVATVITEEEMRWSMKNGRGALLDKLIAGGVGQISRRDRASVVR